MSAGDSYAGTFSWVTGPTGGALPYSGYNAYYGVTCNVSMTNSTSSQTYYLQATGVVYYSGMSPEDQMLFDSEDVFLFGPESSTSNTQVMLAREGRMTFATSGGSDNNLNGYFRVAGTQFSVPQSFTNSSGGGFAFVEQF